MKIIKENQNLMVIRDRNIFAFFIGVIFIVVGFLVIFKPDFFVEQPPLWSGFIGIVIGLFIVFLVKTTTITLDKNANKFLIVWKNLIKENFKEYSLDLIKEVELRQIFYVSSEKEKRGDYSYRLIFVLNNGEEVVLNPNKLSAIRIMGKRIIREKLIAARIASFLNVPFQERKPPTVGEALSSLQQVVQKEIEKYKKE